MQVIVVNNLCLISTLLNAAFLILQDSNKTITRVLALYRGSCFFPQQLDHQKS